MDKDKLISDLVGASYAPGIVSGIRMRRDWIVRSVDLLPDDLAIAEMQSAIVESVFRILVDAYSSSVTTEEMGNIKPAVQLVRLDDLHLLVRIESAAPSASIADDITIVHCGVLQRLDRKIEIDDLQGLPASRWFFLTLAREALGQE
jgi:hypothetical protein